MKRALIVLVDGMRPDGLQQANTPAIDRLIAAGASTLSASTVMPSVTLPCITSLFFGSPPEVHGVTSNIWNPHHTGRSLLDVVARARGTAASFYNWEPLRDLSRPGSLQAGICLHNCGEPGGAGDTELTRVALRTLERDPADLVFVYLGHTDVAGHDSGWMTAPYIRAIENADQCIGTLVAGLRADSGDWLTVVTADHGGHGTGHGTESEADMTIPVILSGDPAIASGTRLADATNIIDIAPTVARWLGVPSPTEWHGQAIRLT